MINLSYSLTKPILLGSLLLGAIASSAQRPDRNGATERPSQNPGFNRQERNAPAPAVNQQQRSFGNSRITERFEQRQQATQQQAAPDNNRNMPTQRQQGTFSQSKLMERIRQRESNVEQVQTGTNPSTYHQPGNPSTTVMQRPQRTINDQAVGNNTLRNKDFRSRPIENSNRAIYNNDYRRTEERRYSGNPAYNNRRNNYDYYGNTGHYNSGHSNPYRYAHNYPYFGQRFRNLNFSYNVIPFGGIGYYYSNGFYYRPFGSYYKVVPPPPGMMINILPFGYSRIFAGSIPYYYFGGTYYQQYDNYYRVVEPPLGARLAALPRGAEPVYINGERYYEDNGTYYFEEYNLKNQRLYTVVGVNGVLDNQTVERILNGSMNNRTSYDEDRIIVNSLPPGCSTVSINGQEYFRSPDNVYYEAISDGSNVSYQVVSN